jgi:ribosomal-protein-alanine N-acetyltransferase
VTVGEITIRRMRLEDVPAVHEIDTLSFSLPWPERSFRFEVIENAVSRGWVAEAEVNGETRIIGMLVLWLLVDEAHIATVAVHPDFQRCGIGSRIIVEALEAARVEGARRAFLEVRERNLAAQEMYRKFGFAITSRRPRYYRDTGEDAILMTLEGLNAETFEHVNVKTRQRVNV